MSRFWARPASEPDDSPTVVCANKRPATVVEEGVPFTLVRYVDDNGDGNGFSLLASLIKACDCGGEGCE